MSSEESGNESDSSTSSSGSSSSSSSENQMTLAKPVFIRKPKPSASKQTTLSKSRSALLARIDQQSQLLEVTDSTKESFDGIDDTDDLDPEAEFDEWQRREVARMERDTAVMRELEEEQLELLKRKKVVQ